MKKLLLALVAGLLAWRIFRPEAPPGPFAHSDKVGNARGFLALGLSARRAFADGSAAWLWGALLMAAPLLERLQHAVSPHRQRSLGDALANLLGLGVVAPVALLAAAAAVGGLTTSARRTVRARQHRDRRH